MHCCRDIAASHCKENSPLTYLLVVYLRLDAGCHSDSEDDADEEAYLDSILNGSIGSVVDSDADAHDLDGNPLRGSKRRTVRSVCCCCRCAGSGACAHIKSCNV